MTVADFRFVTIGDQAPLLLVSKAPLGPQQLALRAHIPIRLRLIKEGAGWHPLRSGPPGGRVCARHTPQKIYLAFGHLFDGRAGGVSSLPADHFNVFRAITKYAVVDKKNLYERLGHFGEKATAGGTPIKGYRTPYKHVPKCLCHGKKFRELIAGRGSQKSIVETNYKPYGIPQGAPISDLLANVYLLDFDATVAGWVREIGGVYYRYSDDILIVAPGGDAVGQDLMKRTRNLIATFGSKLEIKASKSSLFILQQYGVDDTHQSLRGTRTKNGLEYLGFRYDGKRVYLRDATISNLRRKVARAAHRYAYACARRYPDKDVTKLKALFNYESLIKQFGKVEDFDGQGEEYRNWTFWTYATRASKIFGPLGGRFCASSEDTAN